MSQSALRVSLRNCNERYHMCSYELFDIVVEITKTKTKTKNALKVFGTNSGVDRQRTIYFKKFLFPYIRSHKMDNSSLNVVCKFYILINTQIYMQIILNL